jgi:PAS domain S-box-containing protein
MMIAGDGKAAGHSDESAGSATNTTAEPAGREPAASPAVLRTILEATADGILVTGERGEIMGFNPQFLVMWKLSPETLEAGNHRRLMETCSGALKYPGAFLARIDAIGALAPAASDDLLEFADGRTIERVSKILHPDNRHAGRVWSFRDITERIRAKEELRHEREWVHVTLSSIGDGVITTDPEGRVTFLNPVATMMTGWRAPEAAARPLETIFNIVNETTREPAPNPVRQVLREGTSAGLAEPTVLIARHGAETTIEDSAAPIRDVAGEISGAVMVFYNVTERRRSEEAVRQTVQRLQLALAAGHLGDWSWTAGSDGVTLGPRAAEILGLAPDVPATAGSLEALAHPDDRARVRIAVEQALALRSDFRIDCRMRRPSGEFCWIAIRGRGNYADTGGVRELAGVIQDITERKQSDTDLLRSRTRLAMALEAGRMGDWEWLIASKRVSWSPTLEAIHGLPPGSFGGSFEDFQRDIHPLDRERVLAEIEETSLHGGDYQIEYRIVKPDGKVAWIEARGKLFRDSQGRAERMAGICMDVTARKEAEEALRTESAITEHLNEIAMALATELDLSRIAQIIINAGTRITRAQFGMFYHNAGGDDGNPTLRCAVSGGPRDGFGPFSHPPDQSILEAVFRDEGVIRLDDVRLDRRFDRGASQAALLPDRLPVTSCLTVPVFSRSDDVMGRLFFGHSEAGIFTARDEKIVLGIAAQASAAMNTARLYHAEQQARAAAEQANRAKDQFLATLSHELRTPLTPVLMILSNLADEGTLSGSLLKDIQIMRRNVELEARLIDDLLDLTRIVRGKLELHRERISVGVLIENAINTCIPEINARRLSLRRELDEPQPSIVADGARITQILWNLLKNAVKFTPEGGTITIRSRFEAAAAGGRAVIEIQDTGIGIEHSRIEPMFDAFEQGGRKITRQFGGLGLGLAIARSIAESHGGAITATSAGPDCGSTFTLTLPSDGVAEPDKTPAGSADEGAAAPASQPADAGGSERKRPRLLLVEDHADTATVLVRMLRRAGYETIHAATAKTALEIVAAEMPVGGIDLILSDLNLPDISGLDLMRELSENYGLRGIAISGYGMDSDRAQSAAAGFSRHLIKPVNIASVRQAIAEVLADRG